MTPHDPFAAVAEFYDLDLEGYEDDLALYRDIAELRDGAILELGCGTGRVLAALAADGVECVGVDVSPAMLARARERLEGVPSVELVEADLRSLDLGRRFSAVFVPLGGLQHMETLNDLVAALEAVDRHLTDEGMCVIDVEAPNADDFTPGPQPLIEHWTREWRGGQVTKLVSVLAHPAYGVREVTWHFDVQPAEGALRRVTEQFTLRTITPAELELAARAANLEVTGFFGDYDLATPFDDGAERLIATLEPFGRAPFDPMAPRRRGGGDEP